jgi:hypothetical protein
MHINFNQRVVKDDVIPTFSYMDQHNVVAPTNICLICLSPNVSSQFVNISLILIGLCILKVNCNDLHINLA